MAEPKLTLSTDEVRASGLFTGRNIYDVPYFQRPYKWDSEKINQLQADVLKLVDGQTDVHFLGAIITHQRVRANSAQSHMIEVIDGQQRLTTIYLYILAAVRVLIDNEHLEEAKALFLNFVVDGLNTGSGSNLRLHTSHEDRARLNTVVQEILDTNRFEDRLVGFTFRRLATSDPSATASKGKAIKNNFAAAKRFFKAQHEEGGLERVSAVYGAILEHLTVVQIEVQDPTNGPKIFDSLNSRQQPMTPGDLIRNDIFARAAESDASGVDRINTEVWLPFYQAFWIGEKNYFDEYFFPYGLIHNPKLTKSQVYKALRDSWQDKEPKEVIAELAIYQSHFMDLVAGGNRADHSPVIADRIARLHDAGAPSSIYPFVMRLSRAAGREVSESECAAILDVLDAFLTRRAVCGIEPTGLHAVFKGLWNECKGEVSAEMIVRGISAHRTVAWPSDGDVRTAVRERPLYGSGITKYVVREYDRSLGGDKHTTVSQLEHVLPQKLTPAWQFSKEEHAVMHNLLSNLLPLSASMNSSLGYEAFATKRARYAADSVFKSVRAFAETYEIWTPKELEGRGLALADWVATRWPDHRS